MGGYRLGPVPLRSPWTGRIRWRLVWRRYWWVGLGVGLGLWWIL